MIAENVDDAVLRRAEHGGTLALLAGNPAARHDATMVATPPAKPYVQTRVLAVSKAHPRWTDGRFRRGDTIELSIRDTTMPPTDSLAYRVCITFPRLHDTRCQHATLDRFWPADPVTFTQAANDVAVVGWYNRINLIAERRLRLVR